MEDRALPVSGSARLRAAMIGELRADRASVAAMLVLNAAAAGAGLVAPWLLGQIVDVVSSGTDPDPLGTIDLLALIVVVTTAAQIVLSRLALGVGYRFGERSATRIRERLLDRALALPPATVEASDTGDLISRGSTDTTIVATTLRRAMPEVAVASVQVVFLVAAVLVLDPRLGVCGLLCLGGMGVALRWYLRRARLAYLHEAPTGAALAEIVTDTARGARTIEALALEHERAAAAEKVIDVVRSARLRTLRLRTVLFPSVDITLVLPVVGVLLAGAALRQADLVTLGTVVAATVYLRQLATPLDTVMLWVEQLQGAAASLARLEGLAEVPVAATASAGAPCDDRIEVRNAYYAYRAGPDVLHGIDLVIRPGERLAVVGASGAGKSTLGRLLAGLDRPRAGTVTVGGCRWRTCRRTGCAPRWCWSPRTTTCSSTRCATTCASPARTWTTTSWSGPWTRSARTGSPTCPTAWTPCSAARPSWTVPAPSSSPWPGWCWPTRTPWCWTRRPRCWTRRPPAAPSVPSPRCSPAARSSLSLTGCRRRAMLTGSPSSTRAGWSSWARTRSCWPPAAPTHGCGARGAPVTRPSPPPPGVGKSEIEGVTKVRGSRGVCCDF